MSDDEKYGISRFVPCEKHHSAPILIPKAERMEQVVDDLELSIVNAHIDRLMKAACEPVGGVIFTDMASDLERCSDHAINIACALADL